MYKILIYTEKLHSRLAYVAHFIGQFNPECEWVCTNSLLEYQSSSDVSINYSKNRIKDLEVYCPYSDWLLADLNSFQNVPIRNSGENFQIFPNQNDSGFDVFAAIFYVLSRIEEYLPFQEDVHHRFAAQQSVLFKNNVLDIPIVDIWVIQLLQSIELKFGIKLPISKSNPSWSLGIDVDQFFKYKHKSWIKNTGGFIRSLIRAEFSDCIQKFRILFLNQHDPYDSFDQIEKLNIRKEQLIFFILSGGSSQFDKNHPLKLSVIQQILKKLKSHAQIGLHPSYSSNIQSDELNQEKLNLENYLESKVEISRQHFLKIRFPQTFRLLIQNGIQKDYSLGYADFPGFRAGTSRAYNWYDAVQETETSFVLIPFMAMDRTFLDYLKLSPELSISRIQNLFNCCLKYGGHIHLVWHNSSYDFEGEWKNWNHVLETLIQYFKMHDHQTANSNE